ncbi:MAG: CPBP family glutamic-type intramembrane protease [Erythrobacter sp.]|jgi:membrane protease YdiL (CAAX protease family)|nr:CPBP family glutamic-type intramembrane protease [Erythrobacter sp.]
MRALATSLPPARTTIAEWAAFRQFLARPRLPKRTAPLPIGILAVLRLYLLDALLMIGIGVIASLVLLTGFEIPQNTLEELALTPGWIAVIIIGAPLAEELMFRSWLSGRPGHLVAGIAGIAALLGLPILAAAGGTLQLAALAALVALVVGAAWSLWRWREAPPLRWFVAAFPLIFWGVAVVFALIHLVNYEAAGGILMLLPLVVPQFIAGTIFGYARVRYGLWASIALHALHNGSAVAVMLLAQSALPEG